MQLDREAARKAAHRAMREHRGIPLAGTALVACAACLRVFITEDAHFSHMRDFIIDAIYGEVRPT